MQKLVPCLWFSDYNCEEALNYYLSVFADSRIERLRYYPDESLDDHFTGMQGKVLDAVFYLNNQKFIALDGGPYFRFNEAVSITVECEDQAEIDYYWERLSHVAEAEQCGWVKDRFGLSWQILPYNMGELLVSDSQIKAMMAMKKIDIDALQNA